MGVIGASYLVMHPGAHLESGEEQGLQRVAKALDEVHRRCDGYGAMVLLETTAGLYLNQATDGRYSDVRIVKDDFKFVIVDGGQGNDRRPGPFRARLSREVGSESASLGGSRGSTGLDRSPETKIRKDD